MEGLSTERIEPECLLDETSPGLRVRLGGVEKSALNCSSAAGNAARTL